ncbi:hypothetical protein HYX01_05010 [Candidatus Woesearchaeota archaeon]|nr:hypothetical protein [Candidatus Woesearchaeota archaeon]
MAKIEFDKIMLLVFFALMLFLAGIPFEHKIRHDFPFGYGASDSFQHQIRAEAIKDMGNFKYEAPYISKGISNSVGRYPPLIYHLAVIFSYASGIETYDSIYFIVLFFVIIAALVMFIIVGNFSKTVALISLPISILIFSKPITAGILWGHWPSLLSQSFLILFFWSVMRMEIKNSFLLFAISLSAVALTHTSEMFFAFLFLFLFFGVKLFAKRFSKGEFKNLLLSLAVFFAISFYYLIIFQNTWASGDSYSFAIEPVWKGNPGFYIAGFGLLLIPIIAGILFSFSKLKEAHACLILAFAMLLSGFLNYIGFGLRSFQIRFFWPIYLSVFFGFGIYALFKLVIRKWNLIYTLIFFIISAIFLIGIIKLPILKQTEIMAIPSIPYFNMDANQGIMNPYHWEALNWISRNTNENSAIYFFYGDIYSQDALLRNTKRVHSQIDPEDFIKSLEERKIKKTYVSEFPGDTGGVITYRVSFFKFEDATKNLAANFHFGAKNICNFDYFVFDKITQQKALSQYNLLIAQQLALKNATKVFENPVVFILKNSNKGGNCIEERSF